MKYLVVSDIHGSFHYMKLLNERIQIEKPDYIILLGDLYYHGPRNPLPEEYNPKEVCNLLNGYKDIIYWVQGNCDAEVDEMISDFKMYKKIEMKINGIDYVFTHGHHVNIDNPPENGNVVMYGHFHVPFIKEKNNQYFINPGSLSIPKENSHHGYLTIENKCIQLKDLDGTIKEEITL